MRINNIIRKSILPAVAMAVFSFSPSVMGAVDGLWIQHPAAALRSDVKESQVVGIVEGNRYVYFAVRGAYVSKGNADTYATLFNLDPVNIFRYDKNKSWDAASIQPLAADFTLSGAWAQAYNYSPEFGVIAVAYDNGTLDFVFDNGERVTSKCLLNMAAPIRQVSPWSITFDTERPTAYIAGSFGYVAVDMLTGETQDYRLTNLPVSWAGRVGDNMVLFAGNIVMRDNSTSAVYSTETYVYPIGDVPSVLASPLAGGSNLQALMPLGGNKFAALAPNGADTKSILRSFEISGAKLSSKDLETAITVDNGSNANYRHLFRTDGYFQCGKDGGYVVHSSSDVILLDKNGEVKKISKPNSLTANEKNSKAGSLDGSRVWLYTYENKGLAENPAQARGFYSYTVDGNAWTDKTAVVSPNGPTSSFMYYAEWNPDYGLMTRSIANRAKDSDPDYERFSVFKDGVWADKSSSAVFPAAYEVSKAARNVRHDPSAPNYVWGFSRFRGLLRADLLNPESSICLGSDRYKSNNYPGYFPLFKRQPEYDVIISFSNVDFDSDADYMWVARYWLVDYYDGVELDWKNEIQEHAYTPLYYLTKEERGAALDENVVKRMIEREIRIPKAAIGPNATLLVLKAEQNKNLIAVSDNDYRSERYKTRGFIFDHAGTPSDTSDDRSALLVDLVDEEGNPVDYLIENGLYEDTVTGELWMFTTSGPFIMDPREIVNGGKSVRKHKVTHRDGIEVIEHPLEFVLINGIADDNLGRKWVATESGLYCLSPDGLELLGHYTSADYPLPSDNVFNVACDAFGTVFVLTDHGMVEFRPEGGISSVAAGTPLSVYPSVVAPDYRGYVKISGVDPLSSYVVVDKEGNPVAVLGTPEDGLIQWDATDSQGKRLPAGKYNVRRENSAEMNAVIIL